MFYIHQDISEPNDLGQKLMTLDSKVDDPTPPPSSLGAPGGQFQFKGKAVGTRLSLT